jgi:hypothetical protein
VNEQEQLALAERVITLAREYVLHDPNVKPRGSGAHMRSSADFERQERLRDELEQLFSEWDTRQQEPQANESDRARAYDMLREDGNPKRAYE